MVSDKGKYTILFVISLFVANLGISGCQSSSNNSNPGDETTTGEITCAEDNPNIVKEITIPPEKLWVDTGITLKKGYDVVIEIDDDRTYGKDDVSFSNPVIYAGDEAIIFKVGVDGLPQPVGKRYAFTAGAEHENKNIFIGWNSEEPVIKKKRDESGNLLIEKPEPITAVVKIFIPESNKVIRRVSLYAPADSFWTDETNPKFYWDSLDNALRYIFQISDFPDFRRIVQTVEISASGGQANPVSVIGGPGQQDVQFNLQEGIYYWRVKAQINLGRALNPIPVWTCWSHPFRLGVELGTPPQPPTFLSPTTEQTFSPGDNITFEFTVDDDPSFVFWRMRHVVSSCDQQPSISPNDPNAGNPTPWKTFKKKLGEGNIIQTPKLIASFTYEKLETGNHLFRVEVKDGDDTQGIRIRSRDFRLSVGCGSETGSSGGTGGGGGGGGSTGGGGTVGGGTGVGGGGTTGGGGTGGGGGTTGVGG